MANLNETLIQLEIDAGKKPQIDSTKVKGEPGTGYEDPGDLGDFNCYNCNYYKQDSCGQETMMKVSKRPRTSDGRVVVKPKGCCEYVERMGRKKQ